MPDQPFATAALDACWWHRCSAPPTLRFLVHSTIAAMFAPDGCGVLDIAVCDHHARGLNLVSDGASATSQQVSGNDGGVS